MKFGGATLHVLEVGDSLVTSLDGLADGLVGNEDSELGERSFLDAKDVLVISLGASIFSKTDIELGLAPGLGLILQGQLKRSFGLLAGSTRCVTDLTKLFGLPKKLNLGIGGSLLSVGTELFGLTLALQSSGFLLDGLLGDSFLGGGTLLERTELDLEIGLDLMLGVLAHHLLGNTRQIRLEDWADDTLLGTSLVEEELIAALLARAGLILFSIDGGVASEKGLLEDLGSDGAADDIQYNHTLIKLLQKGE